MKKPFPIYFLGLGIAALALVLVGGGFWGWQQYRVLERRLAAAETELRVKTEALVALETERDELTVQLGQEQQKNKDFAEQIGDISKTVGTLEKLSQTDEELLQKYSKVYFLNENYVPGNLAILKDDYAVNPQKPLQIHAKVKPYLEDLLRAAEKDGITLKIVSAYRSFDTQADLKAAYRFTYGASTANQFSAEQGYSEHQLGTTVDFTTPEIGETLAGFEKTAAYQWLLAEAHKFGFILSYPPNNGYYQYEPWHWRFVGVELASDLQAEKKHFYDLDQREIDKYLVKIFD